MSLATDGRSTRHRRQLRLRQLLAPLIDCEVWLPAMTEASETITTTWWVWYTTLPVFTLLTDWDTGPRTRSAGLLRLRRRRQSSPAAWIAPHKLLPAKQASWLGLTASEDKISHTRRRLDLQEIN